MALKRIELYTTLTWLVFKAHTTRDRDLSKETETTARGNRSLNCSGGYVKFLRRGDEERGQGSFFLIKIFNRISCQQIHISYGGHNVISHSSFLIKQKVQLLVLHAI